MYTKCTLSSLAYQYVHLLNVWYSTVNRTSQHHHNITTYFTSQHHRETSHLFVIRQSKSTEGIIAIVTSDKVYHTPTTVDSNLGPIGTLPANLQVVSIALMTDSSQQVADAVLDDILTHIAVDMACEMHRAIKVGNICQSPKRRIDLYPQVHANEEEMLKSLARYATEEPLQKKACNLTEDLPVDHEEQDEEDTTTPNAVVTRHQQNHTDIWNRIPPKEPKKLAKCTVCDRDVSALRFAPHLDKCMQLGTVRAAAANNTAVTSSARGTAK